jgi:hypothetical protein
MPKTRSRFSKKNIKNKSLRNFLGGVIPTDKDFKNKINKYILKKQDICCEEDIDRKVMISQIFELYEQMSELMGQPDGYLSLINNDLVKFIGYKVDLKKNKDTEGVKLWNEMDKRMYENKMVNEKKVELLLQDVPLYFLLSFLGYASYKEGISL